MPLLPEEELQTQICYPKKLATLWEPPETSWTKLNVDAVFDNFKGAWVVVARDS